MVATPQQRCRFASSIFYRFTSSTEIQVTLSERGSTWSKSCQIYLGSVLLFLVLQNPRRVGWCTPFIAVRAPRFRALSSRGWSREQRRHHRTGRCHRARNTRCKRLLSPARVCRFPCWHLTAAERSARAPPFFRAPVPLRCFFFAPRANHTRVSGKNAPTAAGGTGGLQVSGGYGRGSKKLGVPTANLPESQFAENLRSIPTGEAGPACYVCYVSMFTTTPPAGALEYD